MTDDLCYCNFWTGRTAVHHRREGCTSETQPQANTVVSGIIISVNAAAQPFMTALTEVVHDTVAHLEAAIRASRERQ